MHKNISKYILIIISVALIAAGLYVRHLIFGITIRPMEDSQILYLPSGSTYEQVLDTITRKLNVENFNVLKWVAERKKFPRNIHPGRYLIKTGMSCNELINLLRSGRQTPVMITFNKIRTINDLAGRIGGKIEADSSQIAAFLYDQENYKRDGFKAENIISVFIPDTYEFYWNTGPGDLYARMLREYKKFWNEERIQKAREMNLAPADVSILASIIDNEAARPDEMPRIAGVYLNRLRRGIPLQADPTIKFAINDFSIKRILYKHLSVNSPFNTYRYTGLPPGPISCPSKESLEAVLNAEKHDYLYFAAKPDFSGYHNFSRTLTEHNRYASLYQRELNKRKIYK